MPLQPGSDIDALKFLMEQHGLGQSDLKNKIGSQGVLSEILDGKQQLNLSHQWHYLKPRHALRSIYHVFSLIWFLQFFMASASFEMASIAA